MSKKCVLEIFGIALFMSIFIMGCNNEDNSDNLQQPGENSVTYESRDVSGNIYTLVITKQETRPKYVVRVGDTYELRIEQSGSDKISRGSIKSANSSNLELWPFNTPSERVFSIILSNGKMIGISGTITLIDFNTETAPEGQLTPLN